jgi:hypothetical protein
MKTSKMVPLILLLISILTWLSFEITVTINITTDSESYNLGDTVLITGNLTKDGNLVTDALVAIQVNDPAGDIYTIRTLQTGTIPNPHWSVEIVSIVPLKNSYTRGSLASFNVTIRNNDLSEHDALVMLSFYYGDGAPFRTKVWWNGTLDGGQQWSITQSINIPSDAPVGEAKVYGSTFTQLPEKCGFAYCPEKLATFNIVQSGGGGSALSYIQSEEGNFNMTIRIRPLGGMVGNYTIYACSYYEYIIITQQTQFRVVLITDINGDGTVDITDVAMVAYAYASTPGDPRWDDRCDLNNDLIIDITDVAMVAYDYGKYGSLPP